MEPVGAVLAIGEDVADEIEILVFFVAGRSWGLERGGDCCGPGGGSSFGNGRHGGGLEGNGHCSRGFGFGHRGHD